MTEVFMVFNSSAGSGLKLSRVVQSARHAI